MKQILIYVFMVITVIFMVVLVSKNETVSSIKLLSVDTYYSFIDHEDEQLYIDFYLSDQKHPLINITNYDFIEVHNQARTKSLYLDLIEISYQLEEVYLNDIYHKYTYIFNAPHLSYDFEIEDCHLSVSLINDDSYTFYIGSLSLLSLTSNDEISFDWHALSGRKDEGKYIARLSEIVVEYNHLTKSIIDVSIGKFTHLEFEVTADYLKIEIPFEKQLLTACPLIITFNDDSVYIINYFIYMNDFETLKQAGQLIYHYALN